MHPRSRMNITISQAIGILELLGHCYNTVRLSDKKPILVSQIPEHVAGHFAETDRAELVKLTFRRGHKDVSGTLADLVADRMGIRQPRDEKNDGRNRWRADFCFG
jgi:hypothetical protein